MTKAEVEVITSVQTAPALVAGREGKLSAQSVGSEILLVGGAVVSGGAVKIRNGVVEVAASGSENVAFVANGSGGLILDGLGMRTRAESRDSDSALQPIRIPANSLYSSRSAPARR